MKFLLPVTFLASLLLAKNSEAWTPKQTESWNIILGAKVDVNKETADVVEIDFENKSKIIKELHSRGKKVICYFSGGTIEDWRYDKDKFFNVKGLVKGKYEGWDGEYWLDIKNKDLRPLIKARMQYAINEGCDGIDVDNVDAYQIRGPKSYISKEDAIEYTEWLGKTANQLGIPIGLKNGLNIIDTVGKYYSFAINEGCIKRNECHWYKNFLQKGKPVYGITYNGLTESNRKALCQNLKNLPMTMIVKKSERLVQDYIAFDGKKHCGSDFSSGKISSPSEEIPKKTTTVKKITTTTVKKVPTTTVKKVTTTTTVKKAVPTSHTAPKPTITPNNGNNNGNVIKNPTTGATNRPVNGSTKEVPKNPINNMPNGATNVPKNPINGAANGAANGAINGATTNNYSNGSINNGIPSVINGNNTVAGTTTTVTPSVNAPAITPINSVPLTNGSTVNKNNNEVNDPFNSDKENKDGNKNTLYTGIAVSGSVVGAAAVFVFLKKNPRKYENLKRGLSRRATSIKRGASTVSRRLTTRRN